MNPLERDSVQHAISAASKSTTLRAFALGLLWWGCGIIGTFGWAMVLRAWMLPSFHDISVIVTPIDEKAGKALDRAQEVGTSQFELRKEMWRELTCIEARADEPDPTKRQTIGEDAGKLYDTTVVHNDPKLTTIIVIEQLREKRVLPKSRKHIYAPVP